MLSRTIIVGGGAIGLALAWELAQRDHQVTLIERDRVGKGTSWSGAGILPPASLASATDPIDRLRGLSHELFPTWTEKLLAATDIDSGFRRCGAWYLADTPGERAAMIGMTDYWRELSIACQSVSLNELANRESMLGQWATHQRDAAAWWVPDECQVRSPSYLAALTLACRKLSVDIVENASVCDVRSENSLVSIDVMPTGDADQSAKQTLTADNVALCSGTWTGRIATSLQLQQSLVPVRGQMLLLKTERPLFHSIINLGHRYLVPRCDGHVLVGSCEEEVGFQSGTTAEMIASLRTFALGLCPQLKDATEVQVWSGLRPMTFDGFPMIGRVPGTNNVYIAAGHFRSGLHLSPATAVTLADLMDGLQPTLDLDAFRVGKQQRSGTPTS